MNRLEVCEQADITPRMLDIWTKHEWARPIDPAARFRDYPMREVQIVKCIKRLSDVGFHTEVAAILARNAVDAAKESNKNTVWLELGPGCLIAVDI